MFERELERLRAARLLRSVLSRESPQGPRIVLEGKTLLNFASNDYLCLSAHPKVVGAARDAAGRYGFGSGSSRLLAGGCLAHRELEEAVAAWKGTEAALVFNSGYAANTGVMPALVSGDTVIFSDELNHASIIDGCRLSKARTVIYRHADPGDLRRRLMRDGAAKKVVVTDSVFSMDGDIAPLREIYEVCRAMNSTRPRRRPRGQEDGPRVMLYVDDAHGTGVLGDGDGALAHFSITPEPWIIQMGTFSKALGSFGAFVAGSADVVEWLKNTARSLIFSTALPGPVVAASLTALSLLRQSPARVKKLWSNREYLVAGLDEAGFDTGRSQTPIIPLPTRDVETAVRMSRFLYVRGIYAPSIRPPTVKGPRIRISVTAGHTKRQLSALVSALKDFGRIGES